MTTASTRPEAFRSRRQEWKTDPSHRVQSPESTTEPEGRPASARRRAVRRTRSKCGRTPCAGDDALRHVSVTGPERVDDFFSDLETAGPDRGAEPDARARDRKARDALHRFDRPANDRPGGAAPSRVNVRHRPVRGVDDGHRKAIGDLDPDRHLRPVAPDRVALAGHPPFRRGLCAKTTSVPCTCVHVIRPIRGPHRRSMSAVRASSSSPASRPWKSSVV